MRTELHAHFFLNTRAMTASFNVSLDIKCTSWSRMVGLSTFCSTLFPWVRPYWLRRLHWPQKWEDNFITVGEFIVTDTIIFINSQINKTTRQNQLKKLTSTSRAPWLGEDLVGWGISFGVRNKWIPALEVLELSQQAFHSIRKWAMSQPWHLELSQGR